MVEAEQAQRSPALGLASVPERASALERASAEVPGLGAALPGREALAPERHLPCLAPRS